MRPQPPEWLVRQDGRRRRLRPGRAGRRPAAHPRRAHGRGLRARRPDRRPAALRHPRVQDGEAAPRPAAGPDAAEGTVFRAGVDVGGDVTGDAAARPVRRGRARGRRDRRARPAGARAASSAASTRRWSTCRRPTGSSHGQEVEGQISADGKHVVIIGGGDTGADCLGTAHRQGAALGHPAGDHAAAAGGASGEPAVADLPDDLPGLLGARGGRRAGVLGLHQGVRRRRRRQRARRCGWSRCEFAGGKFDRDRGHRARDPGRAGAARDGLHRAGDRRRRVASSASSSTSAATSRATRRT